MRLLINLIRFAQIYVSLAIGKGFVFDLLPFGRSISEYSSYLIIWPKGSESFKLVLPPKGMVRRKGQVGLAAFYSEASLAQKNFAIKAQSFSCEMFTLFHSRL